MATHTISVTVGTSAIQVQPDTLTMNSKEEVRWAGTNGRRFSVEFDQEGAFGKRLTHGEASSARRPLRVGRYKYSIVSDENPALKLDPIIIVEDPPTPPPTP